MKKHQHKLLKHLSDNDTKTLSQQALKLSEETGELAGVALPYDNASGTKHRFVNRINIIEESIDVILCAMSILNTIDCSSEEYNEMLDQKLIKWDGLQQSEEIIKSDNTPFEIHITVQIVPGMSTNMFKNVCGKIGVKPIFLDLMIDESDTETFAGATVSESQDIMTSSIHIGGNDSARIEKDRIVHELELNGYNVIREKIETVPWHPAAPQKFGERCEFAKTYFECHLSILCTAESRPQLELIASENSAHLSRNIFKKLDGEFFSIMMTYRCLNDRTSFDNEVAILTQVLKVNNFDILKEIKEFAIYDNRVSHDDNWINNSTQTK